MNIQEQLELLREIKRRGITVQQKEDELMSYIQVEMARKDKKWAEDQHI